ncbi:52 kda repressor of the inhibitor of the protein kinase [Plakobranchus ocellatus]|uniref:52 kDa repressor of the inhibitor of the protein kinase n=1 Tax=Plakobranchus ocellatus TaxID=259542 RepID=A0AAV4A1F7_9GAST|nr:52 kda repressor of the inhibitor of the protein kinase [Plakobranchus ocellatus]
MLPGDTDSTSSSGKRRADSCYRKNEPQQTSISDLPSQNQSCEEATPSQLPSFSSDIVTYNGQILGDEDRFCLLTDHYTPSSDYRFPVTVFQKHCKHLARKNQGQDIVKCEKAKYFSLLADEATASGNWEQLAIVLRYVDEKGEVHEDFLEFVECRALTSGILSSRDTKLSEQVAAQC